MSPVITKNIIINNASIKKRRERKVAQDSTEAAKSCFWQPYLRVYRGGLCVLQPGNPRLHRNIIKDKLCLICPPGRELFLNPAFQRDVG